MSALFEFVLTLFGGFISIFPLIPLILYCFCKAFLSLRFHLTSFSFHSEGSPQFDLSLQEILVLSISTFYLDIFGPMWDSIDPSQL